MNFNERINQMQCSINAYIDSIIPMEHKYIQTILDSMRYSVFAGGKRLRPILMLSVGELFACPEVDILPYAAAIEMIHTYSLIHDDLPAMDNDDYRRGKPTNHKVYGDSMAILAGDGLLNLAFEHMMEYAYSKNDMKYIKAAIEIAKASGIHGMVGGQVVDIESENKVIDSNLMTYMHKNKTGALITAAARVGAIIPGAVDEDLNRLTDYAKDLGLAFQIVDDILDVTGDEKKLGKKTGSDAKKSKATFVSIMGIDNAKEAAKCVSNRALDSIKFYGQKAEFLVQLTDYLLNRDY